MRDKEAAFFGFSERFLQIRCIIEGYL